jgi:hypothetical protein
MVRMNKEFNPATSVDTRHRGAFTADPDVVKLLACLGIPVWFVTTLEGYVPEGRLRSIQKWTSNPILACDSAPKDWATPNLFTMVHDPYGPFLLPHTYNGLVPKKHVNPASQWPEVGIVDHWDQDENDRLMNEFNDVYGCE